MAVSELTATAMPVAPMPRWFWLLPALAMAAWWPIGAYWASDDFLAVHYAQDLGRAASDLAGRQYAATDIWAFYRPLITLSFWFDQSVAGPWPPFGHASNVVAHGVSTLLVALIWRRFLSNGAAFGAGLLWALMASHVGSIAWAVGRVDSHTTVWCLLAVLLCLRRNERLEDGLPAPRWPMVTATALALMSKELAFVVPPLCTWLSFAQSEGSLRCRLSAAWRGSWPVWLLLAFYMPFRLVVLGTFGGYAASSFELQPALKGLGTIVQDLLVPLRWIGMPATESGLPEWAFLPAAIAPVAIALLLTLVRRPRLTAIALVTFLIAVVPMATFLKACENHHNLRYYYLPTAALAGLLVAGGRWLVVPVVLAWLLPLFAVRVEQHVADQQSRAMHAALLREAPDVPKGPMFVAGLPHSNRSGTAIQLHYGIDRMLQPPFCETPVPLFALRRLAPQPSILRLDMSDGMPFSLPGGSTWWFPDATSLGRAPAPSPLPKLVLQGDRDGALNLNSQRLTEMSNGYQQMIASGAESFGLTTPGAMPAWYRITVFTANGYVCCVCPNHARPGATAGRIDVARMLGGDASRGQTAASLTGPGSSPYLGDALVVPSVIDLVPEFPTLIEAGRIDTQKRRFVVSHRAQRLVTLQFDRGYAAWVRGVQGR